MSGVVLDGATPIAGAGVEVTAGALGRQAVSTDANGHYSLSLDGGGGGVRVLVQHDGYFSELRDLGVYGDMTKDFWLQPIAHLSDGSLLALTIPGTGTLNHPTCFMPGEEGYEESPCRKFLFNAVADGTLDAIMQSPSIWSGIDLIAPDGSYATVMGKGGRRVSMAVRAGLSYEIRVVNFDSVAVTLALQVVSRR